MMYSQPATTEEMSSEVLRVSLGSDRARLLARRAIAALMSARNS